MDGGGSPRRLGRYRITRPLGRGGQGQVFEAVAEPEGARVALKLLHPRVLAHPGAVARLQREGALLRQVRHPGLLQLLELGEHEGAPYLVYELIDGAVPLDEALRGRPLLERTRLVRDAARALGALHAQGIVHRDVTPANVLVDPAGRVRVGDLGLARGPQALALTSTGEALGTAGFVAPEVGLLGSRDAARPSADVWSLGVLLFLALTGRHPFPGAGLGEVLERLAAGAPSAAALLPGIPPSLDEVCRLALDPNADRRPPDGEALARALDAALTATQADPVPPLPIPAPTPPPGTGTWRRAAARLEPGARLGRWTLVRLLGAGGMGQVFLARDGELGREVALKLLEPAASEQRKRRFLREISAAGRVRHPALVQVHDAGEADGWAYLAMEVVQGQPLAELLERGALPARRSAELVRTLAEAVAALHASGVLHRDIKPGNVLLDEQAQPRLFDFGVALLADEQRMTRTGVAVGTPIYMAPESISGPSTVDERVDVYGLGCVLYELLAGQPPYEGQTLAEVMAAKSRPPDPIPGVDPALMGICAAAMAPDPHERLPQAQALAEALQAWLEGRAAAPRRRISLRRTARRLVPALLLIPLLVALAWRPGRDPAAAIPVWRRTLEERGRAASRLRLVELEPELLEAVDPAQEAAVGSTSAAEEARGLLTWVALVRLARDERELAASAAARAGPPMDAAGELLLGGLTAARDPERALQALARAEHGNLTPRELHTWRLLAHEQRGVPDRAAAEHCLTDLAAAAGAGLDEGDPERALRASCLLALGRDGEALSLAERLDLATAPPRIAWDLALLRAETLLQAGKLPEALALVRAASPPPGPPTPRARRVGELAAKSLAEVLEGLGERVSVLQSTPVATLLELHARLLAQEPLSPVIRDKTMALVLALAVGRADPAVILAAVREWPTQPDVLAIAADQITDHEALDSALLWSVQTEQLLMAARAAVALCPPPDRHRAMLKLVHGLVRTGHDPEAEGLARAFLPRLDDLAARGELHPADAPLMRGRLLCDAAMAVRHLGRPEEALRLLAQAQGLPGRSGLHEVELLRALLAAGRTSEAADRAQDWALHLGDFSEAPEQLHEMAWTALYAERRWEAAARLAAWNVARLSDDWWIHRLAGARMELGDDAGAAEALRSAPRAGWNRVSSTVLPRHPAPGSLLRLGEGDPAARAELRAVLDAAEEWRSSFRR